MDDFTFRVGFLGFVGGLWVDPGVISTVEVVKSGLDMHPVIFKCVQKFDSLHDMLPPDATTWFKLGHNVLLQRLCGNLSMSDSTILVTLLQISSGK